MKAQRIKAEYIPPLYSCSGAPLDGAMWVLPADAASYAAMMSQVSYALHMADARGLQNEQCAAHVLRAIGITAARAGTANKAQP